MIVGVVKVCESWESLAVFGSVESMCCLLSVGVLEACGSV